MSKFRKVCALLCSSMCVLGTGANAQNPGDKTGSKTGWSVDKKPKVPNQMGLNKGFIQTTQNSFLNSQQKLVQGEKDGKWPVGFDSLLLGARFGGRTKFANAVGKLSVLSDEEILKRFEKLDLDFIAKMAKSKQTSSNWMYALRWIVPIVVLIVESRGTDGLERLCARSVVKKNTANLAKLLGYNVTGNIINNEDNINKEENMINMSETNGIGNMNEVTEDNVNNILRWYHDVHHSISKFRNLKDNELEAYKLINGSRASVYGLLCFCSFCGLGGYFNYLSQKQQGQSDELRAMSERIKEMQEEIKSNVLEYEKVGEFGTVEKKLEKALKTPTSNAGQKATLKNSRKRIAPRMKKRNRKLNLKNGQNANKGPVVNN